MKPVVSKLYHYWFLLPLSYSEPHNNLIKYRIYFNHFRDGETEAQGGWFVYLVGIGWTRVLTPVALTHCLITVD